AGSIAAAQSALICVGGVFPGCPPPAATLFPYTTLFRSEGREPDGVDAEIGDVVEPLGDADEIADAVAVMVLKRAGIDLVDDGARSEEHTSELQSRENLVCRLLLEKKHRQQQAADRSLPR